MDDIQINRYTFPETTGFSGWIEPGDRSWILFIANDGTPALFARRDPETGAIEE